MKKLLIALIMSLSLLGIARADVNVSDVLKKIPVNHQCLIYNIEEGTLDYATTFTLAKALKDKVSFDLGYAPSSQLLGAVSVKLVEIKDFIKFPILDLMEIEPMLWIGINRIENFKDLGEYNYGVGVKLLSLKF